MKRASHKGVKGLAVPTHLDLHVRQWPGEAYGVVFDCASATSLLVSAPALRLLCDLLDDECGAEIAGVEPPASPSGSAGEDDTSWGHSVSELQGLGLIERTR